MHEHCAICDWLAVRAERLADYYGQSSWSADLDVTHGDDPHWARYEQKGES